MNIDKLNDRTRVYYAKNLKYFALFKKLDHSWSLNCGRTQKECLQALQDNLKAFTAPSFVSFEVNKFSKMTFATPKAKHEPHEKEK